MQERPFPCSFHCLCLFADQVFVTYHQFCVVSFASWSEKCLRCQCFRPLVAALPPLPAGRPSHQQLFVNARGNPWLPRRVKHHEDGYGRGLAGHLKRTCQFFADRMPIDRNEDVYRVWELQYAGIPGILRMKFITWRLCGLCPVIQQTRRRLLLGAMELSLEGRDKHDQQEPNPIGG